MTVPAYIGRYQVLERIGEGGMGALFLSRDPAIERLVAIKLLRHGFDSEEARQRFAREARAAGRLHHPHVVTIFDVGEHEGTPFIAMEFLAGETLAQLIRQKARLTIARRLKLVEELCDGLAYAHRSGLVHRDIKPANVMVDSQGVLKILDFGIVRTEEAGMTGVGEIVGTVNYMSPEQVGGDPVDHRSDIFSVGVVAYELLSYAQAFPGTMKEGLLERIRQSRTVPLAELSPGLDPEIVRIIERAMAAVPADRYQDLARMRNDIATVRQRLEREELQADTAYGEETAVLTVSADGQAEPVTPELAEAGRAIATGHFQKALSLASRVAAIQPESDAATAIIERAKNGLLSEARERRETSSPGTPASAEPSQKAAPPAGRPRRWRTIVVMAVIAVTALLSGAVALFSVRSSDQLSELPARAEPARSTQPTTTGASASADDTSTMPLPSSSLPRGTETIPSLPQVVRDSPARSSEVPRGVAPAPRGNGSSVRGTESGTRTLPGSPTAGADAAARDALAALLADARRQALAERGEAESIGITAVSSASFDTGATHLLAAESLQATRQPAAAVREYLAAAAAFGRAVREGASRTVPDPPSLGAPEPVSPVTPAAAAPPPAVPPAPPSASSITPPSRGSAAQEPSSPGPAPSPADEPAIRQVLQAYEAAWESLDLEALRRVEVLSQGEADRVRRTMDAARQYDMSVAVQAITIGTDGRSATVVAVVDRQFRPRVGRASRQTVRSTFTLEKRAGTWAIVAVR